MTFTPKATNFQASKVSLHFYTDFKAEISSMQTQIKRKPIISDSISHCCCCCSVAQSCVILQPYGLQHARSPCPSPSPKVCPNSCPLHWWCHPAISSSDVLFSFCPQSFPATGTFPMSQLFALDDQNTRVSTSASVLPTSIQDWFPLRLTKFISLLSKGLSGVLSNTTVRMHQYFCVPLS